MDESNLLLIFKKKKAWQKLVNLFGRSSVVEIWPLNETSGTVANGVVNGLNGSYTGVDLGNTSSRVTGYVSPFLDGTNDFANLYSMSTSFNGQEGTIGILGKVSSSSVWSDATVRYLFNMAATTDLLKVYKSGINTVTFLYTAGGITKSSTFTTNSVDWNLFSLTWSKTNDSLKMYLNSTQQGATLSGLGTWVNSLTARILGARTLTPADVWNGYLSFCYILNRPATQTEIETANKILGG